MASTSKKATTNLPTHKATFSSIDKSYKIPILYRKKKFNIRKMISSISAENISNHSHHIIPCDSGFTVCEHCGLQFRQIYECESNPCINTVSFKGLLEKNNAANIKRNLHLIFSVISHFEFPLVIFNRSLNLFQKATNKIEFKKGTIHFYALSSVFYSIKEIHRFFLSKRLLELYYGNIDKDLFNKFHQVYNEFIEKLKLKRINLCPDFFLSHLSNEFRVCRENDYIASLILFKTIKFLPFGKRMAQGIAAGVFYISSKMNENKISQKKIAEVLRISIGSVSEYANKIINILSCLYCNNKNVKIRRKNLSQLKNFLKKYGD